MDIKKIKILVSDLDGVLTTGSYFVSDTGSITKEFNTKDWWALEQIQNKGIKILILTGSTDLVISKKIEQLPASCKTDLAYATDVSDKKAYLIDYIGTLNITLDEVAYIGDSGNDLTAMQVAGFTACPADALSIIKAESNYVSSAYGGKGSVCEICMFLLNKLKD